MLRIALVAVIVLATAFRAESSRAEGRDGRVEMPVTRVVLFSSGVGYFEHAGEVEGDARVSLRFTEDSLDDVLKSLVVLNAGGGTVRSVDYPSKEPIERALRSFAVDLSGDPTLPQLLDQLRGSRLRVEAPRELVGSLLAVQDERVVTGDPPVTRTEHSLVLVTDEGMVTVSLDDVARVELVDATLRAELNAALQLLVESRDSARKPVEVRFEGDGERSLRFGYLVEAPVWKSTYRLDLTPLERGERPLLQGWAIIENTTDSDWSDVQLSLVSGRPISFRMELYGPLYLERPVVKPELMASLRPREHAEGIDVAQRRAAEAAEEQARKRAASPIPLQNKRVQDIASLFAGADRTRGEGAGLDAAVSSAASAGSVGELFEFTLRDPLDLARQRSALVPIVNQTIDAEKVSIFDASVHEGHPLNGVVLKNDTGLKLLAGPITVLDGSSYAGDARIGHLAPGDRRLITHAVDLAVTVDASEAHRSEISAVTISRGVMSVSREHVYERSYVFENDGDADRDLVVEHPRHQERELIEPEEPWETTPQLLRFRTSVEAGATRTLLVRERQVRRETIRLLTARADALLSYSRSGRIAPEVRDVLSRAIDLKRDVVSVERRLERREAEVKEIESGQGRLRDNIATVGIDSELGRRYVAKLSEQEDRIEALERQVEELRRERNRRRGELERYIESLELG